MQKLAIVGTHPATREQGPYKDPEYDIWVFNEAPQADWCKRWDVDFQLHVPDVYMSAKNYSNPHHWPWLQENHPGKVIYMWEYDELVPNSRKYPLEEIIATVPGGERQLFHSSPVLALALGIYLGYKEIHIWGVELSSNTEYFRQLPGWMYWVGICDGMGIKLVMHSGEVHFQPLIYGRAAEAQLGPDYYKGRIDLLEKISSTASNDMRKMRDECDTAMMKGKTEKVIELSMKYRDVAVEAGTLAGAINEANYFASRMDPVPRQEIERRAAAAQKDSVGHQARMHHAGGKLEYVWNIWRQTANIQALSQVRVLIDELIRNAESYGSCIGVYKENMQTMATLDEMSSGVKLREVAYINQ